MLVSDPHEGNVGVTIEGLDQIPETTLIPLFEENLSWLCILYDVDLAPSDAAYAHLRLYDFGRSKYTDSFIRQADNDD